MALKAAATPEEGLTEVLTEMIQALRGDTSTLRFFLRYLLAVSSIDAFPYIKRVAAKQEGGSQVQTIAEHLMAEGYRRGDRHGLRRGRAKGKAEGRRDSLKALLVSRFKTIAPRTLKRIDGADAATLKRWFDSALQAKSVREVFND